MVDLSAPLSDVGIANVAIDVIDDLPISSLDEEGVVAEWLARNYVFYRDVVLYNFPWPFAKTLVNLSAASSAPEFGWTYAYDLPSDFLRVATLRWQGKFNAPLIPHEVIGRQIHTNYAAPLPLIYIKRVTNAAQFSPGFAQVFAMTLAWFMASNITGKKSYVDKAAGMLQTAIGQATITEGLGAGTPEAQSRHDIVDVRGVGLNNVNFPYTYTYPTN